MMERVLSLRNTVPREGSSGSSHSETAYEVCSNRLPGFPAAPRPRINGLPDRSDISLPQDRLYVIRKPARILASTRFLPHFGIYARRNGKQRAAGYACRAAI